MTRRSVLIAVATFVLLLPAVTSRLNASDEIEYFAWLRSWTFDRNVDFENEYRYFHDREPDKHAGLRLTFIDAVNEAGRRPNFAPIGSAILWAPFYAAGHIVAVATGAPTDGFSQPYIDAVVYGSAIYGLGAVLLSMSLVGRLVGSAGTIPALALWFGTPLVFYMYIAPGFSHACSAFTVSLFLWTWLRVRTTWSIPGVAALGLIAGLLPMVREQDAFFVLGPALDFCRWAWPSAASGPERRARRLGPVFVRAAAGVAIAAVAYLPQLLSYQALNGHPSPTIAVSRKMDWTSPHVFDVLISPQHGLFFWTPLVVVCLFGVGRLALGRQAKPSPDVRWIAGLFLIMVAAQIYVSGAVLSWTVAGSFGQRRFVAMTPILIVGLAALFHHARAWPRPGRLALAIVVALSVWWNLGMAAAFGLHRMDRQRLDLAANVRTVFLELPLEAPGLAWRYWTDRESLFGLPRQR